MKKETIIKLILVIISTILIEVMVFNITSYRALLNKNIIKFDRDELEFLKEDDEEDSNDESVILITPDINTVVKTVKVEFEDVVDTEYTLYYSDDTSVNYRALPSKVYVNGNERSAYTAIYLSGNTNKMLIKIDKEIYDNSCLKSITLNDNIPFDINVVRFIITLLIIALIAFYKDIKVLNSEIYNPKSIKQETIIILIMLLFFSYAAFINRNSTEEVAINIEKTNLGLYNQKFVDALKNGQTYLLDEPGGKLKGLNDPYDTIERDKVATRNKDYVWDSAYYNGHLYVYFGILPALLVFLPYNLITGLYLSMSLYVLAVSLIAFILLKILLDKIINKYYNNIPFKLAMISHIILLSGTLLLYIISSGRVYEAMIISGLDLVLLGYINIFDSMNSNKNKFIKIFFGSLCLALSVACRPTCLIASIVIVPYLLNLLNKYIKENKKNLIKLILTVGIPYMIVGISLMYYNYIRFDSIFEFGAKYQLTINNMNELKSRIYTIFTGGITNLFLLPKFSMDFPYFTSINSTISFNGYYYIEDMIAGLFIISPICFITFSIFKFNKNVENKSLKIIVNALLIAGLIIEILSTCMAGSIQRYIVDYSWMFVLASIMIFLAQYLHLKTDEGKEIMYKIYLIIAVITVIFAILGSIISEKNGMKKCHPSVFYNLKYTICFWE